jgi:hypothetical protein
MSTVGKTPKNAGLGSGEPPVSSQQLHRDRINLILVVVVFGVLIGLMIWLASMGPPAGDFDYSYPLIP